jgi:energy-coupling factor transporter transmembrane protein EcfT
MSGVGSVSKFEKQTMKASVLHALDGRVKLIVLLFIIVYAVYTTDLLVLAIMEVYLIALILVSHLSLNESFKRVIFILPFGGVIAIFQPFIIPGTVIYTGPLGLQITYEGPHVWSAFNVKTGGVSDFNCYIILFKSDAGGCEFFQKIRHAQGICHDLQPFYTVLVHVLR